MGIFRKVAGSTAILSTLLLTSCSKGVFSSPLYLAVTVTPRPIFLPVGGTVVLTGIVSNNLSLPRWSLLDGADTPSPGTLTAVSNPNSILYTAPAAPPIYSSAASPGFTQGTVTVAADVTPPPGSSNLPPAHDAITIFIIAPAVSVAISPAVASVALNGMQQFTGYAVGSANNALTWEVNGVAGGSMSTGTITAGGLYTAPASNPMTGSTVTITVVSQADPTKTASGTVNLM
jgi:hypothetical protein